MKIRLVEILSVQPSSDITLTKTSSCPIIGFSENEIMGESPNEVFPLVIVATMANHDVSRILVDVGSSSNMMYKDYHSSLGYMNVHVTFADDEKSHRTNEVRFWMS